MGGLPHFAGEWGYFYAGWVGNSSSSPTAVEAFGGATEDVAEIGGGDFSIR